MTDALAEAIGLVGYATNSNGIGGVIKARVTDFRVEEIATPVHPHELGDESLLQSTGVQTTHSSKSNFLCRDQRQTGRDVPTVRHRCPDEQGR
jgi:hypothetical protein